MEIDGQVQIFGFIINFGNFHSEKAEVTSLVITRDKYLAHTQQRCG